MGATWVLCRAAVEEQVPSFLLGPRPGLGHQRVRDDPAVEPAAHPVESRHQRRSPAGDQPTDRPWTARGHRHEKLGERQIMLDCTVLQADGGTRTAWVTGAYVALALAVHDLLAAASWRCQPARSPVAAVSSGWSTARRCSTWRTSRIGRRRRRQRGSDPHRPPRRSPGHRRRRRVPARAARPSARLAASATRNCSRRSRPRWPRCSRRRAGGAARHPD